MNEWILSHRLILFMFLLQSPANWIQFRPLSQNYLPLNHSPPLAHQTVCLAACFHFTIATWSSRNCRWPPFLLPIHDDPLENIKISITLMANSPAFFKSNWKGIHKNENQKGKNHSPGKPIHWLALGNNPPAIGAMSELNGPLNLNITHPTCGAQIQQIRLITFRFSTFHTIYHVPFA